MANKTKAEGAALLLVRGIPRKSFSIPELCARNDISPGFYDKLKKMGLGAKETRVLDRTIVTDEHEAECL